MRVQQKKLPRRHSHLKSRRGFVGVHHRAFALCSADFYAAYYSLLFIISRCTRADRLPKGIYACGYVSSGISVPSLIRVQPASLPCIHTCLLNIALRAPRVLVVWSAYVKVFLQFCVRTVHLRPGQGLSHWQMHPDNVALSSWFRCDCQYTASSCSYTVETCP
eukprot:4506727-Pleurochrysis_carterae.AAC.2